jgi:hypothetical protein
MMIQIKKDTQGDKTKRKWVKIYKMEYLNKKLKAKIRISSIYNKVNLQKLKRNH